MLGGDMKPPPSPQKRRAIVVETIGFHTSTSSHVIKYIDENKWLQSYDSDGELGPFYDAVENKPRRRKGGSAVSKYAVWAGYNYAGVLHVRGT